MIKDEDSETEVCIPEYKEEEKQTKEIIYDEQQFQKLSRNTNEQIMSMFNELDSYVLSLNENIKKGTTSVTEKSIKCKEIIKKHALDFGGTLSDKEVMTLCKISRNSYYKYKRELKEEL